ncbi:Fic family protein [Candidatus Saccharibacteria bacterium]|nr:Fic family protein [Candidatus Saccharibacteria bacterium]
MHLDSPTQKQSRRSALALSAHTYLKGKQMHLALDLHNYPLSTEETALITEECVRQGDAGPDANKALTEAYITAQLTAQLWHVDSHDAVTADELETLIFDLIAKIKYGTVIRYRTTSVRFANFTFAINAANVPNAMQSYCEAFVEKRLDTADEAYRLFEEIHPFNDGNGRVGWLLWCLHHVVQGEAWPIASAPDLFSQNS